MYPVMSAFHFYLYGSEDYCTDFPAALLCTLEFYEDGGTAVLGSDSDIPVFFSPTDDCSDEIEVGTFRFYRALLSGGSRSSLLSPRFFDSDSLSFSVPGLDVPCRCFEDALIAVGSLSASVSVSLSGVFIGTFSVSCSSPAHLARKVLFDHGERSELFDMEVI